MSPLNSNSNSPQSEINDTSRSTLPPFVGDVAGGEDPESSLPIASNSTSDSIVRTSDVPPSQLGQDNDPNPSIFSWHSIFSAGLIPTAVGILTLLATIFCNMNTVDRDQKKSLDERFLKTIELIGHEKASVRSGGIIALKQISQESEDKQWEIIQILALFVRKSSPYSPKAPVRKIEMDVQIALDVIKKRDVTKDIVGKKKRNYLGCGIGD
jgi:hypothetical protein